MSKRPKLTTEEIRDATRFLDEWRTALMRDSAISPAAFRAGYALSTYVDWRNFECFPSQDRIAADTGTKTRAARYALKELDEAHYIVARRRARTSKLYRLDIPAVHRAGDERKKASAHDGSHDRQKSAAHSDHSDRQKSAAHEVHDNASDTSMSENMTGNFSSDDRQKSATMTGKILPPNDIHLTTTINDTGAVAAAARLSAQADAAPSPREPASGTQYPAEPFPKDSSLYSDGSLTRLMARSPSEEESKNGNIPPFAGERIPQTLKETSSGAASLLADDDWRDDEEIDPDEEERLIAKERREEERDAEIVRQRNSYSVEDDLDADHPF